jgi:MFS family permease
VLSLTAFQLTASTFAALGVVLPDMVRDLRLSWTQAGLAFTLMAAACGSSSLAPALLIRRFGVRATLVVGAALMALGFLALATARGALGLFAGAVLCGVGFQMMALIPGTHVLAAAFPRRAFAFGVYFTFNSLGAVAGPWLVWLTRHVLGGDWRLFWQAQIGAVLILGALCAGLVGGRGAYEGPGANVERTDAASSGTSWTVRSATRTPQFAILALAYFAHLLVGAVVGGLSIAHLTQRGVGPTLAGAMLSLEALVQTGGRAVASLLGERVAPRALLLFALACLAVGAAALSVANGYPLMLLYAVGSGLGFGLTALSVSLLLFDWFGREHSLELFSLTCLVGAAAAVGPMLGGVLRDATGSFALTFQIPAIIAAAIFTAVACIHRPLRPIMDVGESAR